MKVLTWNIAGRNLRLQNQLELITSLNPEIITLQEVIPKMIASIKGTLGDRYYLYDTISMNPKHSFKGPRKYGVLIASKWRLKHLQVSNQTPWPERFIGVEVKSPRGTMELFTTHIPPGVPNGWLKIDFFEAIYRIISQRKRPLVLTGDFNSPKEETATGDIITWGTRIDKSGAIKPRTIKGQDGTRWVNGEKSIIQDLVDFNIVDTFRYLNGYEVREYSWYNITGNKTGRRFDHIFASMKLEPVKSVYIHKPRIDKLSDHSPLFVTFKSQ